MSLFKFLSNLFAVIAGIFHNLPNEAKAGVTLGEQVVENLKNYKGDIKAITDLIPGNTDEKVVTAITNELPVIVTDLQLVANLKGETDPVKIVNAAKAVLESLAGKSAQWDFYDALATQIGVTATSVIAHGTTLVEDAKTLWNDIKYTIKWFHDHKASVQGTSANGGQ